MRLKLVVGVTGALLIAGCKVGDRTVAVTEDDKQAAIAQAEGEISDALAIMPHWYRTGLRPDCTIVSSLEKDGGLVFVEVTTEAAVPYIDPVPSHRASALLAVVGIPGLLILIRGWSRHKCRLTIKASEKCDRFPALGTALAISIKVFVVLLSPFLMCEMARWLFAGIAFVVTGVRYYYIPQHFSLFCSVATLSVGATVLTGIAFLHFLVPFAVRVDHGNSKRSIIRWCVRLFNLADAGFTVRDLYDIVTRLIK